MITTPSAPAFDATRERPDAPGRRTEAPVGQRQLPAGCQPTDRRARWQVAGAHDGRPPSHHVGPLDIVRVFDDIPAAARRCLEEAATAQEPRDGTLVFAQSDRADAIYAAIGGDGRVRIRAADCNSKQLMFNVFKAGDIFGEIGVLDGGPRTAEALVEGRLRLLRIPAASFLQVLGDTPELGCSMCRLMAQRMRRTSVLLRDAVFESLSARLARQVLYLADLHGRHTEQGVRLAGRFRQADLADLLGATPRSIITILNDWRQRGIVTYDPLRGQLTVRDEELRGLLALESAH
jgi:CRP-like cAMP-binding protein